MAYIGFFPTTPGFQAINFKVNNQTRKTATASGRISIATNATTTFSGTLKYPQMTLSEFLPIQAFVSRCQGGLNEFDLVMPTVSQNSLGISDVNAVLSGSAAAGVTQVSITSSKNSTKILNPGDVIRFPNHTKVYMVTNDSGVTTDGGGAATINIEPALITAVSPDSALGYITTDNVPFRMIFTNDLQEFGYRTDGLVSYEIDVTEVI